MQADLAFVQALRGTGLSDADRKSLDADHLFPLALREVIELLPKERERLSADHLFILAVRGTIKLTAEDKQSCHPIIFSCWPCGALPT